MDIVALEPSIKFITAGISMVALIFSWRALSVSQRAFTANHRSWVTIAEIEVLNVHDEWSQFGIKLENISKAPAQFHIDVRLSGAFSHDIPFNKYPIPSNASNFMTLAPGQTIVIERWPTWEDRGVSPPHLYVLVIYKDASSRNWRRTEAMYWIGSKISRTGVNSLQFDAFGNAKGEALLTNQRMI